MDQLFAVTTGTAALAALALLAGAVFHRRSAQQAAATELAAARIDALLPQTQCGQCGYPGCRPYAEAIAAGDVINKCPPGGQPTITVLAQLLGLPSATLDASHGIEAEFRAVAIIREAECIGCTKCILACPVDAIVGASGYMHTVIASECTGCDLCVQPCPVDCIDMIPARSVNAFVFTATTDSTVDQTSGASR
ncbi:MAG: electron transport complex subunit RsxB [Porticoccaceae bacterium]